MKTKSAILRGVNEERSVEQTELGDPDGKNRPGVTLFTDGHR